MDESDGIDLQLSDTANPMQDSSWSYNYGIQRRRSNSDPPPLPPWVDKKDQNKRRFRQGVYPLSDESDGEDFEFPVMSPVSPRLFPEEWEIVAEQIATHAEATGTPDEPSNNSNNNNNYVITNNEGTHLLKEELKAEAEGVRFMTGTHDKDGGRAGRERTVSYGELSEEEVKPSPEVIEQRRAEKLRRFFGNDVVYQRLIAPVTDQKQVRIAQARTSKEYAPLKLGSDSQHEIAKVTIKPKAAPHKKRRSRASSLFRGKVQPRVQEDVVITISDPLNSRHMLHVDFNWEWSGDDPSTHFTLSKKLGEGSFGKVYKAQHKTTGFVVAIKCIKFDSTVDEKRVLKELDVLKLARGKNIVSYFGRCLRKNHIWILMEYCAMGSVQDMMNKMNFSGIKFTEQDIAYFLKSVVAGLKCLHERGIIHRDLKAANILVTEDFEAKIADFGTAALLTEATTTRGIMGTPLFMSPEVLNGVTDEKKSDIWALGITSIQLADGHPPYKHLYPARAIVKICTEPSPTLQYPDRWSPEFNDFIASCLIKDPATRPTAEQLEKHPFFAQSAPPSRLQDIAETLKHSGYLTTPRKRSISSNFTCPEVEHKGGIPIPHPGPKAAGTVGERRQTQTRSPFEQPQQPQSQQPQQLQQLPPQPPPSLPEQPHPQPAQYRSFLSSIVSPRSKTQSEGTKGDIAAQQLQPQPLQNSSPGALGDISGTSPKEKEEGSSPPSSSSSQKSGASVSDLRLKRLPKALEAEQYYERRKSGEAWISPNRSGENRGLGFFTSRLHDSSSLSQSPNEAPVLPKAHELKMLVSPPSFLPLPTGLGTTFGLPVPREKDNNNTDNNPEHNNSLNSSREQEFNNAMDLVDKKGGMEDSDMGAEGKNKKKKKKKKQRGSRKKTAEGIERPPRDLNLGAPQSRRGSAKRREEEEREREKEKEKEKEKDGMESDEERDKSISFLAKEIEQMLKGLEKDKEKERESRRETGKPTAIYDGAPSIVLSLDDLFRIAKLRKEKRVFSSSRVVLLVRAPQLPDWGSDFTEIELSSDGKHRTMAALRLLLAEEFGVKEEAIARIRKLPDVWLRSSKQVSYLVNGDRLEVLLQFNKDSNPGSKNKSIDEENLLSVQKN